MTNYLKKTGIQNMKKMKQQLRMMIYLYLKKVYTINLE